MAKLHFLIMILALVQPARAGWLTSVKTGDIVNLPLVAMVPPPRPAAALYGPLRADREGMAAAEAEIADIVNRERSARGLPPLAFDARLSQAARQHSAEMGELGYFSHQSPVPGNEDVSVRVRNAGLTDIAVGENIAKNYGYPETFLPGQFMTQWMNSQGHKENILRGSFTHIGVGLVRAGNGHYYATQVFATRRLEFSGIKVVPGDRFRLEFSGRVQGQGRELAVIYMDGPAKKFESVASGADGYFSAAITFPAKSGIQEIRFGIKENGGSGSYSIPNNVFVDTDDGALDLFPRSAPGQ